MVIRLQAENHHVPEDPTLQGVPRQCPFIAIRVPVELKSKSPSYRGVTFLGLDSGRAGKARMCQPGDGRRACEAAVSFLLNQVPLCEKNFILEVMYSILHG